MPPFDPLQICFREAEGRDFESEMAGLQENKKKLDREIRNMETLLDGAKSKASGFTGLGISLGCHDNVLRILFEVL